MSRRRFLETFAIAAFAFARWPAFATQPAGPRSGASDQALQAAQGVFAAAESGDPLALKRWIDDQAIGQSALLDGYALLVASEKQIHYNLSETSVALSREMAEVNTRWERRSISNARGRPMLQSGVATLQFVQSGSSWKLRAVGGENPFIPAGAK